MNTTNMYIYLTSIHILHIQINVYSTYEAVVLARTSDAIKNSATTVSFDDYFKNRTLVEQQFREAVQKRWDVKPSLHATLDQFHVGRIQIPDVVALKQLTAKIQVEKNKEEEFLQQARIEREITAVEVNTINLEKEKHLKEAKARANLIVANAFAESERIKNGAINTGTRGMLTELGINSEEHSTAYTYIRTLQNRRQNLGVSISYLSDENVVKTTAATSALQL
jgi:SPFH domain / Band 7 family.